MRWPDAAARGNLPWPGRGATLTICVLLLSLVTAVFAQCVGHQFTLWDDPQYVSHNAWVLGGLRPDSVSWAFSAFWASNWHPLTWLSHLLDVELWGRWAGGHHLTSVLLHASNAMLLWLFLVRTTGAQWRSAWVAALFAIHPLHVESVAWVSERKDVLSGFFFILTLFAYRYYVQRPGWGRYVLVTTSLAAGLMAKPMLVTLPAVLLLLDLWPLSRLPSISLRRFGPFLRSPALIEKLPWLFLCVASAAVTVAAQREAMIPAESMAFGTRLSVAVIAYATYLWKMVWPVELSFFYGVPADLSLRAALAVLTMTGVAALAIWAWRSRRYPVVVGVLWYLLTLIPVVGFVKVGWQAYADRYTYLPLIGIFIALAWLPGDRWLAERPLTRRFLAGLSIIIVAVGSWLAWQQTSYWRDSEALFARAIEIDPANPVALVQYGDALIGKGDLLRGEQAVRSALRLSDGTMVQFNGWIALGNVAFARREYDEANRYYTAAAGLGTKSALPDYNLGTVLLTVGRVHEAREHFLRALDRHPRYAEAYANLGVAEERSGQPAAAVAAYEAALRIDAENRGARSNLERLLMRTGSAAIR